MSKLIRASMIYLNEVVANNADIGLYDDYTTGSTLRWIEADISAYSPTYEFKIGLFAPDWFEPFSDGYDGKYGGTVGEVGSGAIKLISAINYEGSVRPLFRILPGLDIRLNGKRIDIYEFEISGGSLVDPDGTIIFRGECGELNCDEYISILEIKSALLNRRSNLGTIINEVDYPNATKNIIGEMVPITIGEYSAEIDQLNSRVCGGLARFDRTADFQEIINNSYFDFSLGRYPEIKRFPVTSGQTGLGYNVGYRFAIRGCNTGFVDSVPTNLYVRVVDGKGNGNSPRKVAYLSTPAGTEEMVFWIDDVFEEELDVDDSSDDGRSWIDFIRVCREYSSDIWPCGNFLNYSGVITIVPELYSFNSNDNIFSRLAEYGYYIDTVTTDKNKLIINPMHFSSSDMTTCSGFVIIPVKSFYLIDTPTLIDWKNKTDSNYGSSAIWKYKKKSNGIYVYDYGNAIDGINYTHTIIGSGNEIDKDPETYFLSYMTDIRCRSEPSLSVSYCKAFGFTLPDIRDDFDFDSCYLGISKMGNISNAGSSNHINSGNIHIRLRRFSYYINDSFQKRTIDEVTYPNNYFDDLPSFYYSKSGGTNDGTNDHFYRNTSESDNEKITGYKSFDLSITNKDDYRTYIECAIWLLRNGTIDQILGRFDRTAIFELAIIFKVSIDIDSYIYTPYRGRIFNSTFDSMAMTDLIDTPKLAFFHTLMLQNWSEQNEYKKWGKEYPTTPLIDITTNEGGFNFEQLDQLDDLKLRRQIIDGDEAYTDSILESLCNDFFVVPSQDHATGNERLSFIGKKYNTSPTTTITLSDIIGKISSVSTQPEDSIFCEPIVRYNYNNATEKYDGLIQIRNASAATYDASYVIGISGSSAENVWNKAHVLWKCTGKIETIPESCSDKKWIYREEDAIWYLNTWLYYMGAVDTELGTIEKAARDRIAFDIPYAIGKSFFRGMHINLSLPFHTESISIECVIEKVSKGLSIVSIEVMLLDNITEDDFYYIKSITVTSEDHKINKVIPEIGDENDIDKVL
jgi:hypothetical protein